MNTNTLFGFEELELWKKARIFKQEIRKIINAFPAEEKYRLADQLIRSTRSISALIAEGHGRYSYPDQIHFCIQARGSLAESINHLIDSYDEGYIPETLFHALKEKGKEIERMLNGYLIFLRKKRDEQKLKGISES